MNFIEKKLSNTKKEILLVLVQALGGFVIPRINNNSIVDIYQKYETDFRPARWVFLIWPILYISLCYGFYKQEYEWDRTSENLFECVTVSNLSWVYFWTKDNIILSNISFIPLCFSLYKLFIRNINNKDIFLQNTLSAYLSWGFIAGSLNFASVLKYKLKFKHYQKLVGFLLCFFQIAWAIKGRSIKDSVEKTNFYKNSNMFNLVGVISLVALSQDSINIKKELIAYGICLLFSCYNQIQKK